MTDAAGLTTAVKARGLAVGLGVGLGAGVAAQYLLPSPEAERRLERRGISTTSSREATATVAPMTFVSAAAIGTGISRRSGTAALTTASLGAAAMLASTGASTMIHADSSSADKYIRTLGLMTGVAAASFAVGAMDEVPLEKAKIWGLRLVGFAAGGLLPETASFIAGVPAELGTSFKYRDR